MYETADSNDSMVNEDDSIQTTCDYKRQKRSLMIFYRVLRKGLISLSNAESTNAGFKNTVI